MPPTPKPMTPAPPPPPPAPPRPKPQQEIVYPTLEGIVCVGDKAITYDKMKEILGWEDETEYKERMKRSAGNDVVKGAYLASAGFGDKAFLLKDVFGNKVRCHNNTKNRPFERGWADGLCQICLKSGPGNPKKSRQWKVNGEPLILGCFAQVLSGQHRGIGFMLAVQKYRKIKAKGPANWSDDDKKLLAIWPTEPVLETFISIGIDEEADTIGTIDNVKPRSLADVFYTTDVFGRLTDTEKAECSRMLETGVKLLWKRTGVDELAIKPVMAELVDYTSRHPRLLRCVKHIFDENKERQLSNVRLSPGHCSALMYLMGSCGTQPLHYMALRKELPETIDWTFWDKAVEFFSILGSQTHQGLAAVREALSALAEDDEGGGRISEKHAIVCKGWNVFKLGFAPTAGDLKLTYGTDAQGNQKLEEKVIVEGIDMGVGTKQRDAANDPDPSEIEAQKVLLREQSLKEKLDVVKKAKKEAAPQAPVPKASANGHGHPVPKPKPPPVPKKAPPVPKRAAPVPKK